MQAPEVTTQIVDEKVDIFAYGITLMELWLHRRYEPEDCELAAPASGDRAAHDAWMYQWLSRRALHRIPVPPPPLSHEPPVELPADIKTIIEWCVAIKPQERPQADELLIALLTARRRRWPTRAQRRHPLKPAPAPAKMPRMGSVELALPGSYVPPPLPPLAAAAATSPVGVAAAAAASATDDSSGVGVAFGERKSTADVKCPKCRSRTLIGDAALCSVCGVAKLAPAAHIVEHSAVNAFVSLAIPASSDAAAAGVVSSPAMPPPQVHVALLGGGGTGR